MSFKFPKTKKFDGKTYCLYRKREFVADARKDAKKTRRPSALRPVERKARVVKGVEKLPGKRKPYEKQYNRAAIYVYPCPRT